MDSLDFRERWPRLRRVGILAAVVWLGSLAACSPAPSGDDGATEAPAVSATLRFVEPPASPGAMAPALAAGANGVFLSWLEPFGDGGHALYTAQLREDQWTPKRRVAASDTFFANWADVPAVVESADGNRFAHWLQKLGEDTYAYGAELARSRDGGETWEALGLLHDDASPTEHGFVSYAVPADGEVQAFWLDGRQMLEGGAMHLRTTRLADSPPEPSTLLDDRVCECCSTDAAMTSAGPIVVYRDRSDSEVRDIAVVRATAEGWSEPAMVHDDGWEIHGCPVNGPAVAAEGERVVVAWFSAPESGPRVAVAFSDDAGASFRAPIVVDDVQPLGRVDVALDREGRGLMSWMGFSGEGAEIRWRRVEPGGGVGPVHVVAQTTVARSAGVPRMLRRGEELVFAWVEDVEPSRLRVAAVPGI